MIDDVSRYNYFCQFRSIIRSSRHHLIVGIDNSKRQTPCFFWHSIRQNFVEAVAVWQRQKGLYAINRAGKCSHCQN